LGLPRGLPNVGEMKVKVLARISHGTPERDRGDSRAAEQQSRGTARSALEAFLVSTSLARIMHETPSRDRGDGRATGQPQGLGPEAYSFSTSQGARPEDARKDGHSRDRSRWFPKTGGSQSRQSLPDVTPDGLAPITDRENACSTRYSWRGIADLDYESPMPR
jgi:hypothetical protein